MIPVRKLVSAVCEAVKDLRDARGTSFKTITAYIKHKAEGNIDTTSIRKAVIAAVENNLLKETRDGKYKLEVADGATVVDKTENTAPQPTDCG